MMTAVAFSRQTDASSRASFSRESRPRSRPILGIHSFFYKVSVIQVPNHSPSLGSSSIYDGNGSVNVTQKAVGMLAYIPSRSICQILANCSGDEF